MAVDGVSDFIKSNMVKETVAKQNSDLSMDDFFQLMISQLKNQDMFSPMDNSEFMSQMAQFSMVNALMDMSELSNVSYSTSLIGKMATVAFVNAGKMGTDTGIIDSVNLFNGKAEVIINGEAYALSNIMTVNDVPKSSGSNQILANSATLIGKTAMLMHPLETGNIEVVSGKITSLKLVDNEVYAVIDGRSFPVSEITSLSETNVVTEPIAEETEKTAETQTNAEIQTGAGTQNGAGAATGAEAQTGVGTQNGAGAATGAGTQTGAETQTGVGTQNGAGTQTGAETQTVAGAATGAGTQTGARAATGTGTQTGVGTQMGAEALVGAETGTQTQIGAVRADTQAQPDVEAQSSTRSQASAGTQINAGTQSGAGAQTVAGAQVMNAEAITNAVTMAGSPEIGTLIRSQARTAVRGDEDG